VLSRPWPQIRQLADFPAAHLHKDAQFRAPTLGPAPAAISDVQICMSGGAKSAIGSRRPPKPCPPGITDARIPPMGGFTAAISDVQICISGGTTSAIGSWPPSKPCQLATPWPAVPTIRKPENLPDSTSLMSPAMCGPPSANLQKVRPGTPPDLHCPALPAPIGGPWHVPEQTCSGVRVWRFRPSLYKQS